METIKRDLQELSKNERAAAQEARRRALRARHDRREADRLRREVTEAILDVDQAA